MYCEEGGAAYARKAERPEHIDAQGEASPAQKYKPHRTWPIGAFENTKLLGFSETQNSLINAPSVCE